MRFDLDLTHIFSSRNTRFVSASRDASRSPARADPRDAVRLLRGRQAAGAVRPSSTASTSRPGASSPPPAGALL